MSDTIMLNCPFCGHAPTLYTEKKYKDLLGCSNGDCILYSHVFSIEKWSVRKAVVKESIKEKCLSCDSEAEPTFSAEKSSGGTVQGYKCTSCGTKHVVEESIYHQG